MHGPQAMLGWVLGALVSICDGLVWAELGAAMPDAGGPYRYLLEAYGPRSLGRLMSFLYLWQFLAQAPLGWLPARWAFRNMRYNPWPNMTGWQGKLFDGVCCSVRAIYLKIEKHGQA